jgi:hypothetical protein
MSGIYIIMSYGLKNGEIILSSTMPKHAFPSTCNSCPILDPFAVNHALGSSWETCAGEILGGGSLAASSWADRPETSLGSEVKILPSSCTLDDMIAFVNRVEINHILQVEHRSHLGQFAKDKRRARKRRSASRSACGCGRG